MAVMDSLVGGRYDNDMFTYAWKKLMQNHPHDSICACSCDEVYDEMKTRFAKAEATAQYLRDEAAEHIAAGLDTALNGAERAIVVYSLDPHERTVVLKAYADFDPAEGVQAVSVYDREGREIPSRFSVERNRFTYTLPKDSFRKVRYADRFEIELQLTLRGVGATVLGVRSVAPTATSALSYTERSAENEYLRIEMNGNGSFDLCDKRGGRVWREMNIFEDTQDRGNLYNYIQPEGDKALISRDRTARVTLDEVTPLGVTFKSEITLCEGIDVATYATLRQGAARVDIRTEVTNRADDHRLRALFASDVDTDTVLAEGQFDVVRRNITPAPVWKNPCNAQRMQAFVTLEDAKSGDALMIASRGLPEYEVLRDGRNTLALTMIRAIGDIGDWGYFPSPKGQMKGSYTLEYSVIPYSAADRARAYGEGYSYAYPAAYALGCECHGGEAAAKLIEMSEEYIRLSAIKRSEDGERVIVRLFNTHTEAVSTTLTLSPVFKSAALADLAEREQKVLEIRDGRLVLDIGAKKIITLALKV
jgi:alpha-mannosidase